jgi:hypothetical protein
VRIKVLLKAEEIQSVLLATDANGNLGYVPNANNYDRGDYKSTMHITILASRIRYAKAARRL